MKRFSEVIFVFFVCLLTGKNACSQSIYDQNAIDLTLKHQSVDLYAASSIRIFDGFLLKENVKKPQELSLNNRIVLPDSIQLENMGDLKLGGRVVFLNSDVSDMREYIYNKANIGSFYLTKNFNLPIILNGTMLTFDKYNLLNKISVAEIRQVLYIKKYPANSIHSDTPLGVIIVETNK